MAGTRRRGFAGQAVVSVLGAVALAGAGLAAVFGAGSEARSVPLRDGAAWVQSLVTGSLERLDTGSGAVSFRLTTPLAARPLEIVDDGTTTFLRDPATGAIRAIDLSGATAKLSAPADLARDARLVSAVGLTFVLLPERGELALLDPATLAVGPMVDLGGPLGSAAVDGAGTLWVAVPSLGIVVPVTVERGRPKLGERTDVGGPGTALDVTISSGVAYGVDRAGGVLLRLRPGRATAVAQVPVQALVAEVQGDPADGHVVVGDPSGAVVRIDPGTGRTTRFELAERAGHRLGPPVQARNRIAIPDLTTGELIVIDPATGTSEAAPVRTGPERPGSTGSPSGAGSTTPGEVPVTAVDGAVVANDPASATAVVVTPVGEAELVDKGGQAPGDSEPVVTPAPGVVPNPLPVPQPEPTSPTPAPAPAPAAAVPPVPARGGPAPALPVPSAPAPGSVRPPAPPGAVQGLRAIPGNTTVDLTWMAAADGGSALTGHRAECSGRGGSVGAADLPGTATTATIRGLVNGVDHSCTVVARNGAGAGPATSSGPVRPLGDVPGAPSSVSAVPGDGSIAVQWSAPAPGGAPVADYLITAAGASGPVTVQGPATQTAANLGGLVNGTPYDVTVRARAASGAAGSPAAAPGPVIPAGPPGAPQAVSLVARSRAMDVRWQPAAANGSPVSGYIVQAQPGGHRREAQGTATQVELDQLVNGTQYSVTVTATNAVGVGPASPAKTATPGDPEITTLGAAPAGGTRLEVTFGVDWKGEQPGRCGVVVESPPDRSVKHTFAPDCSAPSYPIDAQYWGTTFSLTGWASFSGGEVTRGPVVATTPEPPREYLSRSMNENPRDWFHGLPSEGNPYALVQDSGIWVYTEERPGTVRLHRWSAGPNVHWYGTQIQAPPPGYWLDKTLGWIYNFTYTGPTGTGIKRYVRQDFQGPSQGLDCYLGATDFPGDLTGWTDDGLMGFSALPP